MAPADHACRSRSREDQRFLGTSPSKVTDFFDRKKYKTIRVRAFIVVMFTETVGVDNKLNLIRFLLFPLDLDLLSGQKIVLASWL